MILLYFMLWVIFLGDVTPEICLFGVMVAAVMFAFTCRFMDYSMEKERRLYHRLFGICMYGYVLIAEIVRANMAVIHMILSEREELRPVVVHFRSRLKTPMARSLMADAITLTPGTITVSLEGEDFVVHCLDESLAVGMDESEFAVMLSEFERPQEWEQNRDGKGDRNG
ncbi:MAG: Na+/H+ antiporter subunit E [Clostridiales bacterium]|nr:Na+/H+ antiporter subunit E [Clostridiales bacterium]